jgi:signal transduction histidine kinase
VIVVASVVGSATLASGVALALALRRLPTVRWQLAGLALVSVVLPLAAVLLSGLVMFHMGADVATLAVSAAAATAALAGAVVLARGLGRRLEELRTAALRLAAGELEARVPVGGAVEIDELARSFNTMARNLEQTFDARRELIAWASHDLRAPVSSLQAMLEAIEDGVVAPEHYLQSIQGQVRLLAVLIEDLFELACVDAGAVSLDLVVVDLAALAESVVARFDAEARQKGVGLEVQAHGADAPAPCAPDKVERVLSNLLANALRYTPTGGHVVVSVTTAAGAVLVSVEDSGVGIAAEAVDRVFEPFFRVDTARAPSAGSGLGLSIARSLIEAHGGRIWIERPANGGTRVCFALPSTTSSSPSGRLAGPPAAAGPVATAVPAGHPPRRRRGRAAPIGG